jgi:hypothetical protein
MMYFLGPRRKVCDGDIYKGMHRERETNVQCEAPRGLQQQGAVTTREQMSTKNQHGVRRDRMS